jgi:hypothetical protein
MRKLAGPLKVDLPCFQGLGKVHIKIQGISELKYGTKIQRLVRLHGHTDKRGIVPILWLPLKGLIFNKIYKRDI